MKLSDGLLHGFADDEDARPVLRSMAAELLQYRALGTVEEVAATRSRMELLEYSGKTDYERISELHADIDKLTAERDEARREAEELKALAKATVDLWDKMKAEANLHWYAVCLAHNEDNTPSALDKLRELGR